MNGCADAGLAALLERAKARPKNLTADELARLVSATDAAGKESIRAAAREVKRRHCGRLVSVRGLVELGNVCAKDCFYCGIR